MFTINFFHRPAGHKKFTGSRFYQESFPLRNSKTRHKTKHSKMREKHLVKTVTHPWRVSTKIKKQSKHVPNKLPRKKEGLHFFGHTTQSDSGLPALVVALCSKVPNVLIQIGCYVKEVESLLSCLSVVFNIPSASAKLRTTAFCALPLTN